MADDFASYGEIDPKRVYGIQAAARALGMSTRWVLDNLIASDDVTYFKRGDYKAFPGWVLIQWVESDLRRHSEWLEPDAPEEKSTRKKSESKA